MIVKISSAVLLSGKPKSIITIDSGSSAYAVHGQCDSFRWRFEKTITLIDQKNFGRRGYKSVAFGRPFKIWRLRTLSVFAAS